MANEKTVDFAALTKQLAALTGKTSPDGGLDMKAVADIAKKLDVKPEKLAELLPALIKNSGGKLEGAALCKALNARGLASIAIPAAVVKAVYDGSKKAAAKIDAETAKIDETADSKSWQSGSSAEIAAAAEKASEYAKTNTSDKASLEEYLAFAQKARQAAIDRKEALLKAGTDKYSDPVAEMNAAMLRASQAARAIEEKLAALK